MSVPGSTEAKTQFAYVNFFTYSLSYVRKLLLQPEGGILKCITINSVDLDMKLI